MFQSGFSQERIELIQWYTNDGQEDAFVTKKNNRIILITSINHIYFVDSYIYSYKGDFRYTHDSYGELIEIRDLVKNPVVETERNNFVYEKKYNKDKILIEEIAKVENIVVYIKKIIYI